MEVAARFAAGNETVDDDHYNVFDTEVGKLYLPRSSVKPEDKIELSYWKLLWMEGVRIFGVNPRA